MNSRKGAVMAKMKECFSIDTVEDIKQYVNAFNDIQKCKKHMNVNCADCDDERYHEEQDHKAMERKNK